MKAKQYNPAVARLNGYNNGFRDGLDAGFNGAVLLTILAIKNVNAEHAYIDEDNYPFLVKDLEVEMERIFGEMYQYNPDNLVKAMQFEAEEKAETLLYYVNKERERLGMEAL